MDVWQYLAMEKLEIPSIYFSHKRECVVRDGAILSNSPFISLREGEELSMMNVRYRTVGDMTCTGAVESPASSITDIINEIAVTRVTERGTRADDKRSETAMEDRKKLGYF